MRRLALLVPVLAVLLGGVDLRWYRRCGAVEELHDHADLRPCNGAAIGQLGSATWRSADR
jgi:hypothetical protein